MVDLIAGVTRRSKNDENKNGWIDNSYKGIGKLAENSRAAKIGTLSEDVR